MFASFTNCNSFTSDPNWIHYSQVSIMGIFSSTPAMLRKSAELASEREIDPSEMVTGRYALSKIEDAISATEGFHGDASCSKQVLKTPESDKSNPGTNIWALHGIDKITLANFVMI